MRLVREKKSNIFTLQGIELYSGFEKGLERFAKKLKSENWEQSLNQAILEYAQAIRKAFVPVPSEEGLIDVNIPTTVKGFETLFNRFGIENLLSAYRDGNSEEQIREVNIQFSEKSAAALEQILQKTQASTWADVLIQSVYFKEFTMRYNIK